MPNGSVHYQIRSLQANIMSMKGFQSNTITIGLFKSNTTRGDINNQKTYTPKHVHAV